MLFNIKFNVKEINLTPSFSLKVYHPSFWTKKTPSHRFPNQNKPL